MATKTMPEWMRTRLTRQTRRTVSWDDQATHVEKDGEYLLLQLLPDGVYTQCMVRACAGGSSDYQLRKRADWVLDVSKTGVLTTDGTDGERPLAVLINPAAYHMVNVLASCGIGTALAQVLYTHIAYDTPAQGFVTVTTLFDTTIIIPSSRIASIE